MPKARRTLTIQDVAKEAGVSPATVSRVLNGTVTVAEAKASRVRAAATRLNYRPNPYARYLLTRKTDVVGVLVPHLEDAFFGKLVTGIEAELKKSGLDLFCSLGHNHPERETEALELLLGRQASGIILISDHLPERQLLELSRSDLPIVLVNRFLPELAPHCVRIDNAWSGALATEHLIACGHKRVAHISGPLATEGARERLSGYRDALQRAELEVDEMLVVESDFSERGGFDATQRLLNNTSFSALFAANDKMALGALAALHRAGRRVPEDVAVIGFDNAPFAALTIPPLSTIAYPTVELGRQAGRHLSQLIAGTPTEASIPLRASLVVRASTVIGAGG